MLGDLEIRLPKFPRAEDYGGVWAIEPTRARLLIDRAWQTDWSQHMTARHQPQPVSLETMPSGIQGASKIAVVRLDGTLMKAESSFGGTSTVQARRLLREATANADIAAILLAIDSPGGTVAGADDLAKEIDAATKAKPVYAYVSDLCASAAYWCASQCDAIYANSPTAWVGSIGTMLTMYDLSKSAQSQGVEVLVFGTGPLKGAGTEGTAVTEEQRAYFQALVNESQQSFDAAVKAGRGFNEKQLAAVRTGGVFGATEAVSLGLIDGIQSLDATVAALAKAAKERQRQQPRQTAGPQLSTKGDGMSQTESGAATAVDPIAAENKRRADNMRRVARINEICADFPAIAADAIEQGWEPMQAENAVLKARLPKPPATSNPHAAGTTAAPTVYTSGNAVPGVSNALAIEAALRMQFNSISKIEKQYSPAVMEAASQKHLRRITLHSLLMMAAAENGRPFHAGEKVTSSNLREVLGYAFNGGGMRASSFSTSGVSGILSNVANKEILAGYMEVDTAWSEISAKKPVSDFKQVTSYRMLDDMEYLELAPDGKIQHGSASEESYTRQAGTFARMYAITRTQLINDDLGAFQDMRQRVGMGSAKKFNKVFWNKFVNNSSFFTSGRTNYISGSTSNLGTDGVGLGLGVTAFRKMKSPAADGAKAVNGVGGRPRLLLVPPELEHAADKLFMGEKLNTGTAGGEENIYRNKYKPVVAWQLSDAAYTGYSAAAWYLLNDPAYLPTMVVSFLDGNEAPTVEEAAADFDQLGIQIRGYHDFGCDLAEYLGGLKSKGAA
jgi:signal peptide peptidase SppA